MSDRAELARVRQRLAGKWQIPLAVVSAALLVGAVLQIEPPEARIPIDVLVERIDAQFEGQMYTLALADCQTVLEILDDRGGPEVEAARGRVHLLRARALAKRTEDSLALTGADSGAGAGQDVLDAYQLARAGEQELTWQDVRNLGLANEWLGLWDAAVTEYESAADQAPPDQALPLRKRIIELMEYPLKAEPAAIDPLLDSFIAQARTLDGQIVMLEWGVGKKTDRLCSAGQFDEALALIEGLRPVFEPTLQREGFEYAIAWVLFQQGRYDEADAALRALRNRLTVRDELDAKSGWLLGRVVLNDGGPQRPDEALSFFNDVVSAHATGVYVAASRLGMAEALASLERFDESLAEYKQVIESLGSYAASPLVNPDVIRSSMTVAAEELRRRGDFEGALAFMAPATTLVDPANTELLSTYLQRLGDWQAALARDLRDQAGQLPEDTEHDQAREELYGRARDLLLAAAETFIELARVNTLRESRSAEATWRAADLLDEAGSRERTVGVLREFVRERPTNDLVPRALLRLGQSLQAMGRFEEAIEAYQENHTRFPRTPDAGSCLVPLARCFIALGEDYYDQAEKTLRLILEDSPVFTPEAPEFIDALFMLADLLSRQEQYEKAIPLLQEAMLRYPDDQRAARAEFLLADAYRQSGLALREDLSKAELIGEKRRLEAEYVRRLQKAAELFGQLVQRFEEDDEPQLNELDSWFLRYGRIYEADCLFELGRYREALKRYERAAWVYRDTPSALAVYAQMVACHAYLGQTAEARAALRRARHLLKVIDEKEFDPTAPMGSRADWERYFNWLAHADLF